MEVGQISVAEEVLECPCKLLRCVQVLVLMEIAASIPALHNLAQQLVGFAL